MDNLGEQPGGAPAFILTLFGDTPRALAASASGDLVYAAVFLSGNQTTVVGPSGLSKPPPRDSADGVPAPDTGLILKYNDTNWVDEQGTNFNSSIPFSLPDYDVFVIDAQSLTVKRQVSGVGTVIFNMVVDPKDGMLYASNTEARNQVRFSGMAARAQTTVRGHLADHRITLIRDDQAQPVDINPHLDYSQTFGSATDRALSLSTPTSMAIYRDFLLVCALGSTKLGVCSTASLAQGSAVHEALIPLSAGGSCGIAVHAELPVAYVYTLYDNGISTVDLEHWTEIDHLNMFSAEPEAVVRGRRFLYDAEYTSSRGNDSCATCHVFGNTDALAWDLGDPDGETKPIPNTFMNTSAPVAPYRFHPMKGPMTTQSMRGTKGHGPMHWRGDRTGTDRAPDETLEEAAFKEFNEAFEALMARESQLSDEEMADFTAFAMALTYPPNPIRALDNQLTDVQAQGSELFHKGVVRVQTGQLEVCVRCHPIDPQRGLLGTTGLMSDNGQDGERNFKIPHFRDQYQKVGMFGWGFNQPPVRGPQIRGFGYNHNGATSGNYLLADLGIPTEQVHALRQFLFAFPTENAPIVGQQITVSIDPPAAALARIELMVQRALVMDPIPECDLVAHSVISDQETGWLMNDSGLFDSNRSDQNALDAPSLIALLKDGADRITFTCTPWGNGRRLGLDRNLDGMLNQVVP